jgi:hypothetical protein
MTIIWSPSVIALTWWRGENARGAKALLELLDLDAHLHPQLGVEIREPLVEPEGGRLARQRAKRGHRAGTPWRCRDP